MPKIAAPSKLLAAALPFLVGCAPTAAPTATPSPVVPAGPTGSPAASASSPSPSSSPGSAVGVSPSPSANVTTATVQLTDALKFEPASLTVPRGTTVTWRNGSQLVHTVTDDPSKAANADDAQLPSGAQAWDSGDLNAGREFTHTFDVPGTYKYFCQPHETAGMLGTIIVTP